MVAMVVATIPAGAQSNPQTARPGASEAKIAALDGNALTTGVFEWRHALQQVDSQFQAQRQRIKSLDDQLKQMESELQSKSSSLPREKILKMAENTEQLRLQLKRERDDAEAKFRQAMEVASGPVRVKLGEFLKVYAAQHNIDLIVDLAVAGQAGLLLYVNPRMDVTGDFIAQFNKANPVKTP
jgi:Skp family chaperone for outer membrane proteins